MAYVNKKEELMDACMRIIADKGMSMFSMKQVTDYVGVSEALVYRHFGTKENFLYACYESTHRQVASLFEHMTATQPQSREEAYAIVKLLWMRYFEFLVGNGYRTLFYFEYRNSGNVKYIREKDELAKVTYFKRFGEIFKAFDEIYHIYEQINGDYLWTYILDTAGVFAKRVIRGELPDTEESYEIIFKLIATGIMGLLTA